MKLIYLLLLCCCIFGVNPKSLSPLIVRGMGRQS